MEIEKPPFFTEFDNMSISYSTENLEITNYLGKSTTVGYGAAVQLVRYAYSHGIQQ